MSATDCEPTVFSGLRRRLTLLYVLAALLLIGLVSGGKVLFVTYYFQVETDTALQHTLVQALQTRRLPVPAELAAADQAWRANRLPLFGGAAATGDEDYDGELASIFVVPVTATGRVLPDPNPPAPPPGMPDGAALAAALNQGQDWRTVQLRGGARLRLLTYRVDGAGGLAAIQVGRVLADQDRVLEQMLIALVGLGAFSAGLVAAGSWWLAGRSLRPAQEAWARQQAFVANASHELRTPLTLIRASADVAQRELPPDDRDQRLLLADILRECDHMGRLIDDLLLLSRLDAGELALERAVVRLPDLVAEVERQFGRLVGESGIALTVGPVDGAVWGDRTRLRQILFILLDNALRHTPTGGAIAVSATPRDGHVRLTVADTGSGIPPEALPHVFDRFFQADSTRGGNRGRSGLGLAIAKALIEAQHGQIAIDSQVTIGTRIVVTLPAALDAAPHPTVPPAASAPAR